MPISPGSKLGPYQILAPLGAGGMGEVYRAHDPRLGRDVAIKVLPADRMTDESRRRRFVQEARAASALNHPNIITIHEIESADGIDFIVMEYVRGRSLSALITRQGMPLAEVLRVAIPIADALARAHAAGIVHRDLKPANVMVGPDGTVKVLDFGLAKLLGPEVSDDEHQTMTRDDKDPISREGTVAGTPGYMSPEQEAGRKVDSRSDVFSFGALLYEMVTGRRAFGGGSSAQMPTQPSELVPDLPRDLERLIQRCLRKERDRRFQHMLDVKLELEQIKEDSDSAAAPASAVPGRTHAVQQTAAMPARVGPGSRFRYLVWAIAVAGVAALGFWLLRLWPGSAPAPAVRMAVTLPAGTAPADPGRLLGPPVVAPDGSALVISLKSADTQHLYIRRLDSDKLVRLEGTQGGSYPFWSPDGRQIAFFAEGKLKKMPAAGGVPVVLCAAQDSRGGAWGRAGTIVFGINYRGIFRVAEDGGEPVEVTRLDAGMGENSHRYPVFLPDGQRFLYFSRTKDLEKRAVYLDSLDRKQPRRRILVADGQFALGIDPHSRRHFVLTQQGKAIVAQRFDTERGELIGEPRRIVDTAGQLSASDTGMLVLWKEGQDLSRVVWLDRGGRETGVLGAAGDYWQVELAPDGGHVAVVNHDYLSGYFAVWLATPAQGLLRPLSDPTQRSLDPVWSPRGRAVYYHDFLRQGTYRRGLDPGDSEELVLDTRGSGWIKLRDISADEKYLVAERSQDERQTIKLVWSGFGSAEWQPLAGSGSMERLAQFSPDGRWIAYDSNQSGTREVYVIEFPSGRRSYRISTAGGHEPHWRADGKELFYISNDGFVTSVELSRPGQFEPVRPRPLFRIVLRQSSEGPLYAVTPDGQRFLAITGQGADAQDSVEIILNWASLLK